MTEGPLVENEIGTTKREVLRRIDSAKIPSQSIIFGSLVELMDALRFPLVRNGSFRNISLLELEGVLNAFSEKDIFFVGSTMLPNIFTNSKIDAAFGSRYALLPYPETWFFEETFSEVIHPGLFYRPEFLTGRGVIKKIPSQGGDDVIFINEFNPSAWSPPDQKGRYIYMEEVSHKRPNERTRDSRIVFWPFQDSFSYGVEQVIFAVDRVGGQDLTNVSQGGEWQGTMLSRRYIRSLLSQYLTTLEGGIIRYALKFAFMDLDLEDIVRVYQRAGVRPTNGLIGIDIIFPGGKYPGKSGDDCIPVAIEVHDCFDLPDSGLDSVGDYLMSQVIRARRPVVLFRGNHMIAPLLITSMRDQIRKLRRIPILVEDSFSRSSEEVVPFLDLHEGRSKGGELGKRVDDSLEKIYYSPPHQ